MTIKEKLRNNQITIGSWITIGHHSIVEIVASAGFDWLTIDMEHSSITLDNAQILIATIQSCGVNAFVRVGKNDDLLIKRVMDTGADGVIVPMINSHRDARLAVEAVKYPPDGKRGVGLARAQKYGVGFDEYNTWVNSESVIIVQIEHIKAVENIDSIISTDGVDGIIIGPYDLSASMGIPGQFNDPAVIEALKITEKACKRKNFPLGFHVIKPNHSEVIKKINEGYTFIAFSLDFYFLGEKVRKEMEYLRERRK